MPFRHEHLLGIFMKPSLTLSLVMIAIAISPASAGTREDILSRAARCSAIADDHTWLDCYYGAAQPMRSHLGLPPAPESQTLLVPSGANQMTPAPQMVTNPPPAPQKNDGGVFSNLFGGSMVLNRVPATAYTFDRNGMFKITLADGSVWQQVESDDSFAKWREPANHYLVSITTGSLGSFNLQVQGDNKSYKVKRKA
jgi:hypothetical protein